MIDDGRDAVRAVHGVESKIAAAGLNAGGHALVQEHIPVDGLGARYVRLRWLDRAPTIASVEIEVQANQNPATPVADTRQWHDALVARVGHAAGEYLFETTGAYPVDRLRFDVPQLNTLTHAVVYSRTGATAPWRAVAAAVLYRLQGAAGEQRNLPLEFAPDSDREWRVVVDASQGGLGRGALTVGVGWQPASLTFVARGAPPFTLAVGNSELATAALPREELLIGTTPVIATAQVGEALPASRGEAQEAVEEGGDTWRRYVLWAALLLAVGVLGAMAWRLMRQR